jgi:hypothetical protein
MCEILESEDEIKFKRISKNKQLYETKSLNRRVHNRTNKAYILVKRTYIYISRVFISSPSILVLITLLGSCYLHPSYRQHMRCVPLDSLTFYVKTADGLAFMSFGKRATIHPLSEKTSTNSKSRCVLWYAWLPFVVVRMRELHMYRYQAVGVNACTVKGMYTLQYKNVK